MCLKRITLNKIQYKIPNNSITSIQEEDTERLTIENSYQEITQILALIFLVLIYHIHQCFEILSEYSESFFEYINQVIFSYSKILQKQLYQLLLVCIHVCLG